MKPLTKQEAKQIVRQDLASNRVKSRRQYGREWGVPPSTAYYWIREAIREADAVAVAAH